MTKLILALDLIPASSWFSNCRSVLTKSQWDIIRNKVYSEAYYVCEICGETGSKHPVECHEIFSYDTKNNIQKLVKLIALCPNCHSVKHYGLSKIKGKEEFVLKHFMKVNKLNKKDALKYINKEFEVWAERNKIEWKLDLSLLKNYGIKL